MRLAQSGAVVNPGCTSAGVIITTSPVRSNSPASVARGLLQRLSIARLLPVRFASLLSSPAYYAPHGFFLLHRQLPIYE